MLSKKIALLSSLFAIQILSLITIWSTTPSLFLTQLSFVIVGALVILFLSRVDLSIVFNFSNFWYYLSLALLVLTYFLGKNIRGSVRWIDLGLFNLQTSEIVKPMLAIFFADYLANNKIKSFKSLFIFLLIIAIPVVIIARQPDLGSALSLLSIPLFLLVFTGHFKKLFLVGILGLIVIVPLELKFLKPYQKQRIETFINPYKDPKGAGYNVIQATIAVGSGGLIGKGVRLGTQSQLNFLPERHTDFIFASFSEEFGLLGALFLIFCLFNYLRTVLYIYKKSTNLARANLALSIIGLITFQSLVNIGMNIGIMPVTGITLPFFSYGGSSLLSFAIFTGFMVRELDLIPPIEI